MFLRLLQRLPDVSGIFPSQSSLKVLEQQSNSILTAIVHGMRKEEPSVHVRLAATNALLNSLEFTKKNFGMEVSEWDRFFFLLI